jgi:hypothetical protein
MVRFLLIFSLLILFTHCKKNEDSLEIVLDLEVNGEKLELGKTYKDYEGRNILFNAFKLYFSDIEISDGSRSLEKDVLLFVAERNMLSFLLDGAGLNDSKLVKAKLGLDTFYNNQNPIKFPDEHPLSLDQNTYWSMLKYRFLVIEGRIDTSASKDKTPNFPFTYHIGRDTMLRDFTLQIEGKNVIIPLELLDIFNGIDMTTHFDNHSETPAEIEKGIVIMDNLACILNQCVKN